MTNECMLTEEILNDPTKWKPQGHALSPEIVWEFWNEERTLTIYWEYAKTSYVKAWGCNLHTEMEHGIISISNQLESLLFWLKNGEEPK